MPEQYDEKPQVQQVAQIINGVVFSQLLATSRRAWLTVTRKRSERNPPPVGSGFPGKRDHLDGTRFNAGMRVARRQNRPFLPSPGQFCCMVPGRSIRYRRTAKTSASWLIWFTSIAGSEGLYPDAESYPWKSNAHYWLVTNLYQNMRANALTDAELRRKAADELTCMTARINRGETIPEPVKQLPVMGGRPLNRVQALAKIAEIKAKFGLKGASV